MELTAGDVKVVWEAIGEGVSGEYDPDDPNDVELLRFTVYHKTSPYFDWTEVDDASYCTQVPVNTPSETLTVLLARIFNEVYDYVQAGESIKKICERLSWIAVDDAKFAV